MDSAYSSAYSAPQRNASDIVLYLSSNQPIPPVPFELQGQITPAVWSTRLTTLANTSQRYSKVWLERIWLIVGFLSSLVLPAVLYSVIYNSMNVVSLDGNVDFARLAESRMITFALFLGVILFFFAPLAIWKIIGRKQTNRLTTQWTKADRMNYGQNAASTWKVKTPSVFRDSTILSISLPPNTQPTSFHPNAYLPSYINAPTDGDASYYYPYKSAEVGVPRMSVVGNVPLYVDEKRAFEDFNV